MVLQRAILLFLSQFPSQRVRKSNVYIVFAQFESNNEAGGETNLVQRQIFGQIDFRWNSSMALLVILLSLYWA